MDTTIVPVNDGKGKPIQYIAMRFDITDKKENQEKIRLMAFYDHLTGLVNRRKFDDDLIKKLNIIKKIMAGLESCLLIWMALNT